MITLNPYFEARTTWLSTIAPSGAGDDFYLEPIFDQLYIQLNKFMRLYIDFEEVIY